MIAVLTIHFVVAGFAPLLFRALDRKIFYLLAAVPAGSFIWLLLQYPAVYSDSPPTEVLPWVPGMGLELAFRMAPLNWILCLLVLGVGALVLFYCASYFKKDDATFTAYGRPFAAQLLAFAGVMFGLVTADDLILLFIFWELTTILSYLLIGYARTRLSARRAATRALIVTTAGGLTMLVGLIMLGISAGSYRISEILAAPPTGQLVDVGIFLILIGAISKSALIPFHFWLPGAMAAPTPVSAYLHAAAMVKAGVYVVALFAPPFSQIPFWQPTILVAGLGTMFVGSWRALKQVDLKLILAYGTVSQLGFITLIVGLGTEAAALSGIAMLLAHGLFKAALFLVVGIIDHQAGTRDITKLSGVFRTAPWLGIVATIATASMAGLPLTGGFVAKEGIFEALIKQENWWLLAGVVLGSVLTFAYSARFLWGGFATKRDSLGKTLPAADSCGKASAQFLAVPTLLSALTVIYGLWPKPVQTWIEPYSGLFHVEGSKAPYLASFAGFNLAFGLSALVVVLGMLLFLARRPVAKFQDSVYPLVDTQKWYQNIIGATDDIAVWVTGRTQRGSLFFYIAVILVTATVVPLVALLRADDHFPEVYLFDPESPAQLVGVAAIIIGALVAVRANKRFLAVLMVSITGYGSALIFAFQGAPDLALTQMLIETIALVVFVLAMRAMPAQLRDKTEGKYRAMRIIIGIGFGLTMIVVALISMGARNMAPISDAFPYLAEDRGGGKNIVNVLLVDIRAWDTFGEISVLAVAATGVASLIFVRSRGSALRRASSFESGTVGRGSLARIQPASDRRRAELQLAEQFSSGKRSPWLVAGRTLAPEIRSIILEVDTRLLFHSMVVFSVYLLLAGHNTPGGGFAGGLMVGLALTLRYLAGGRAELAEAIRISPGALLGIGLGIAAISGMAPLLFGYQVFESEIWKASFAPFAGAGGFFEEFTTIDIKFVTSTFFDIGVYFVVVGLCLDVLRSLGAEIDEREENNEHFVDAETVEDQELAESERLESSEEENKKLAGAGEVGAGSVS